MRAAQALADPALATGVVLAGGRGSRIGGQKAKVALAGRPLISYPLAAVEAAGLRPLVVAKRDTELPALHCPVIREEDEPSHPLCGLLAALEHARGPLVAVACDMPLLPPDLLAWLASRPEHLVAPSLAGRPQPFPGRFDLALAPALRRALAAERSLRAAISSLSPRLLAEEELAAFGEPSRICLNVNSPADLRRAAALLGEARDRAG